MNKIFVIYFSTNYILITPSRCFSYESSQRSTIAASPPHSSIENKTFDWDEGAIISQKYVSSTLLPDSLYT